MAGALRRSFGVCANEWSPSDGAVVSLDHGCGAHSEIDVDPAPAVSVGEPILDEFSVDLVTLDRRVAVGWPTMISADWSAGAGGVAASAAQIAIPDPAEHGEGEQSATDEREHRSVVRLDWLLGGGRRSGR